MALKAVNEEFYDFKEDNSFSIGKHLLGNHSVHCSKLNPPLVPGCTANFWANGSMPTITCCPQLLPLSKVGSTIGCYLGSINKLMCNLKPLHSQPE